MNKVSLSFRATLLIAIVAIAFSGCSAVGTQSVSAALPAAQAQTPTAASPNPTSAGADAASLQLAFIGVYERVNPSVVNIRVLVNGGESLNIPDIPGFPTPEAPNGLQQGQGSGFVYDQQGHIVTNNHVVDGAEKIAVTFADGTEAAATLVGADPNADLAVIKVDVDAAQLTPVTLGSSDALKVGQLVIAIGNPFGLEGSMTTGIVSGLGRLLPAGAQTPSGARYSIPDIVQTDAAINPGNSGGPLLDLDGKVIGVNTAIELNPALGSPRVSSGVGYAVPVDIVSQVVPELIANGRVEHPWLGISGGTLSADIAQAMNLDPNQRGVLVAEVTPGSPADTAGLRGSSTETTVDGLPAQIGGDVIVAIDGQPVQVFDELLSYIFRDAEVGQTVTLSILREGRPQDVQVTLEARPTE
ncbi:MAG TPA: trypsin-like peptidase domain-containing protein [Anaerolineae bacterium]|nr:trypsin-like peptidase domain-containing protein [Anaerolineae bacterium]